MPPPNVNPVLAQNRVLTGQGSPVTTTRAIAPGPGRSALTDLIPTFLLAYGGFRTIAIPAGTSINTGAGHSGWFPLISMTVGQPGNFPDQDVYLDYIGLTMVPPETTANGTTNAVWGTMLGDGAAIVIGQNLPVAVNTWTSAPAPVPGIETSGNGLLMANQYGGVVVHHMSFPTGDYNDTAPNKAFIPIPLGKVTHRYPRGTRIDAALVVRGSQINTGANKNLRGLVDVQLRLGLTQTTQGFSL